MRRTLITSVHTRNTARCLSTTMRSRAESLTDRNGADGSADSVEERILRLQEAHERMRASQAELKRRTDQLATYYHNNPGRRNTTTFEMVGTALAVYSSVLVCLLVGKPLYDKWKTR